VVCVWIGVWGLGFAHKSELFLEKCRQRDGVRKAPELQLGEQNDGSARAALACENEFNFEGAHARPVIGIG
jgi:hypothetical protein